MNKYFERSFILKIYNSELVKNSLVLFSGSVIAQALSVILYPVFSRIYSPEQFGTFALFTSITSIAAIVGTGVYEQAILLPKTESQAWSLVFLSIAVSLAQNLIFFLLLVCFHGFIGDVLLKNQLIGPLLLWVPISVFLSNVFSIFTFFSNRRKYYSYIFQSTINQGVVVNVSKIGFGLLKLANSGLVFGKLISQITSTFLLVFQVLKKSAAGMRSIKFELNEVKQVAIIYKNFPTYRMPFSLMNTFSTALPVFILSKYFSIEAAGQYSLATGVLLAPVSLITGSVTKVLNQQIIERLNKKMALTDYLFKILRLIMPLVGIVFILFYFVCENVFVFLFGPEWQQAGKISGILLPWVYLVLFASSISFVLDIHFRQRKALIIDTVYLILRIIAMAIGVYYHDLFLAIRLFVVSGCIVLTYNFIWYISLLRAYDHKSKTD